MPTFAQTDRFRRDLAGLTPAQRAAFRAAAERFVADLPSGRFRAGPRVKGIRGAEGVFEMTWADDGRATFQYGSAVHKGKAHIFWRRIGTHEIFSRP
jgi:hypothetical protein